MHSVLRCYDRPIHCPRHDQPAFTDPRTARARGFLARYRGLTREAYALDLRRALPGIAPLPEPVRRKGSPGTAPACSSWLLQSCEPEPDNLSRVALAVTMITLRTESVCRLIYFWLAGRPVTLG
jgi:hypothetical protein